MDYKIVNVTPILNRYHAARYLALRACVPDAICIETAGKGPEYNLDWRSPIDRPKHGIRTLFPGRHYTEIPGRVRREAVRNELDSIGADKIDAIIVLGWVFDESKEALAWARSASKAVICTSNSTRNDKDRSWYREYCKRKLVRLFDASLVSGTRAREYISSLGIPSDRAFLGYNVVDNNHFDVRRDSTPVPESVSSKVPYILTVARLIEEKNLARAIDAYARYRAATGKSAWPWVICGDGPLREKLEAKRNSLGLKETVIFTGNVTYDEIPAYYAHSGIFWLPSISETWGLAVNEAMCCKLPLLLSTNVGCVPDLLSEGTNGWSFDPESIEQMTSVLLRMHKLPESDRVQMGNISRSIISQWEPERFAQGLKAAVEKALEGGPKKVSALNSIFLKALMLTR